MQASAPNLKLAAETFHVHSFVSYILLILKILIECFHQTNFTNKNMYRCYVALFLKDFYLIFLDVKSFLKTCIPVNLLVFFESLIDSQ